MPAPMVSHASQNAMSNASELDAATMARAGHTPDRAFRVADSAKVTLRRG